MIDYHPEFSLGALKRICPRGMQVQALAFEKTHWSPDEARMWAHRHGYPTYVDDSKNYHRIRVKNPKSFEFIRWGKEWLPGLRPLYGCPRKKPVNLRKVAGPEGPSNPAIPGIRYDTAKTDSFDLAGKTVFVVRFDPAKAEDPFEKDLELSFAVFDLETFDQVSDWWPVDRFMGEEKAREWAVSEAYSVLTTGKRFPKSGE